MTYLNWDLKGFRGSAIYTLLLVKGIIIKIQYSKKKQELMLDLKGITMGHIPTRKVLPFNTL